jgi:hypothetical protein
MAGNWASINGTRITRGSLLLPLLGLWVCDAALPVATVVTNPVTVIVGNLVLTGTVYRNDSFGGEQILSVQGGFGGWNKSLDKYAFQSGGGVSLSQVLTVTAMQAGEKVSVLQDTKLGNAYYRKKGLASNTLRYLAPSWWVDPLTGVTQVGARPSTSITSDFTVEAFDLARGHSVVATEDVASWAPGNTFLNPFMSSTKTIGFVRVAMNDGGTPRLGVLNT